MKPKYTTVFVIREKASGKLIAFGPKAGWSSIAAAKNAFSMHLKYKYRDYFEDGKGLFESQDDYIIEEVK